MFHNYQFLNPIINFDLNVKQFIINIRRIIINYVLYFSIILVLGESKSYPTWLTLLLRLNNRDEKRSLFIRELIKY
jgi:hypothetical protein